MTGNTDAATTARSLDELMQYDEKMAQGGYSIIATTQHGTETVIRENIQNKESAYLQKAEIERSEVWDNRDITIEEP